MAGPLQSFVQCSVFWGAAVRGGVLTRDGPVSQSGNPVSGRSIVRHAGQTFRDLAAQLVSRKIQYSQPGEPRQRARDFTAQLVLAEAQSFQVGKVAERIGDVPAQLVLVENQSFQVGKVTECMRDVSRLARLPLRKQMQQVGKICPSESGITPLNRLWWRYRNSRLARLPSESGIAPLSLLTGQVKTFAGWQGFPSVSGMFPLN